jgi:hypothetical protein
VAHHERLTGDPEGRRNTLGRGDNFISRREEVDASSLLAAGVLSYRPLIEIRLNNSLTCPGYDDGDFLRK